MRNKFRFTYIFLVIFDIGCVIFLLLCGYQIVLQKEEMETMCYSEDSSFASVVSNLQEEIDRLEGCSLKSDELEAEYEAMKRKCDVRIYLESVDLERDKKAYIDKLFSISKKEPQIKSD